jgi:hypothetical protein
MAAAPAHAAIEAGLGFVDEIAGETSQIATLAWQFGPDNHWEALLAFIAERDDLEPPGYAESHTFVAISRRRHLRDTGWFLSSGVALSSGDDDDEILSGHFQFLTGGGWQGEHWAITLRHISNANITGRNRGETFLLVGYRW